MKRQLVIILALSLFLSCQHSKPAPSSSQSEDDFMSPDNYCHDQAAWEKLDNLVRKYPNDSDLQALHALRIGLCVKINQGSIRQEDAIDIFDLAHQTVIEKWRQRSGGKKPSI